jgi:Spherulation-specific family 4
LKTTNNGAGRRSLRVSLLVAVVMAALVVTTIFASASYFNRTSSDGSPTTSSSNPSSSTTTTTPDERSSSVSATTSTTQSTQVASSQTAASTSSTETGPVSEVSTGIIVPMFTNYTLTEVAQIIQQKQANPGVPFLVVANPDDGPGTAYNSSYGAGLKQLQAGGITVLGYDPTTWGTRGISAVEQDASNFYEWYGVNGIYLDQMYNEEYSYNGVFMPTYYSTLTSYIKSLGMTMVFGNAGADVPYYDLGSVDTIGYFENAHLPTLSDLGSWHLAYNKVNFAFFAYNITSLNPDYVAAASDYVSYLYITNGEKPSEYNALPPYFDQLVSVLGSLVPVTVQTDAPNGTSVQRGFNVTVTQPDGISNTAYAPYTFDVPSGSTVTISVENNGGFIFDHWAGGNTNPTLSFKASSATTLVAYSKTSQTNATVVTIHTEEPDGIPVIGIYTTASQNGSIVASGYTPFTFVATRGTPYALEIANYSTYSFSSWINGTDAKDNQTITITPTHDVLLEAAVTNATGSVSATSTSTATTSTASTTKTSGTGSSTTSEAAIFGVSLVPSVLMVALLEEPPTYSSPGCTTRRRSSDRSRNGSSAAPA